MVRAVLAELEVQVLLDSQQEEAAEGSPELEGVVSRVEAAPVTQLCA